MDTAGPFSAVSLKQLKAPEERQGILHAGPFPAVSVDSEDLERHGRPCRHYWLHLQNQSDVWGSGFPPVAESPTPEVPCQLSHPPLPPPPPPPCTNLTFTVPPVPAHLSDDQPYCSCFFSLPPPPSVKVCACCAYCHDEVVHQCPMLSGDPAGPPHGT